MAFKKTFIVSDGSVNSYGFRVETNGIDLTQAQKNCPAYFNHRTWEIPLGHWINLRVDDKGQLLADLVIEGASDEEKEYIRKIENGDIKGASIGVECLSWDDSPLQLLPGQTLPTLAKSDLFEISVAPLPGNKNALALKSKDGFVTLSADNMNLIPPLKITPDMKQIALKLGLGETATEQQIIDAIVAVQLKLHNTEAMAKVIEDNIADKLPKEQKDFFVLLSKTNVQAAMDFLKLNAPAATEPATTEGEGETKPVIKKETKVVDLIRKGGQATAEDGKDTFDYLQKHNAAELARIRTEDPEKYAQLAKDYGKGMRYQGK